VTNRNLFVLFIFFSLLLATFLAAIDLDIWVDDHWGSALTISWSMALLSAAHPFATHLFCLLFGGVVGGLCVHFFKFQQPDPRPYLEPRMSTGEPSKSPPDVEAAARHFATACAGDGASEARRVAFAPADILRLVPADLPRTIEQAALEGFRAGAKYILDHYGIPNPF
jgi:predicted lipid-binding transport protein (Tim44 family)